VSFKSQTEGG